jgi:hypothetical protein
LQIDRAHHDSEVERGHGALMLAAQLMAPDERQRLDAALRELGERLELRANPLADDFADDAPDAQLQSLLPAALPKLTAAAALLAPSWRAPAGDFVVRVVTTCPPAARCVDPGARGGDGDTRRARFLAWPLAGWALLDLDDVGAAERAAARLRQAAAARDSRLALVIGGASPVAADLTALRAHAAQVARRLQQAGHDTRLIDASEPALPSWLTIAPTQILIVPRLGSIAALGEVAREVERIVPEATWLQRPLPLD